MQIGIFLNKGDAFKTKSKTIQDIDEGYLEACISKILIQRGYLTRLSLWYCFSYARTLLMKLLELLDSALLHIST